MSDVDRLESNETTTTAAPEAAAVEAEIAQIEGLMRSDMRLYRETKRERLYELYAARQSVSGSTAIAESKATDQRTGEQDAAPVDTALALCDHFADTSGAPAEVVDAVREWAGKAYAPGARPMDERVAHVYDLKSFGLSPEELAYAHSAGNALSRKGVDAHHVYDLLRWYIATRDEATRGRERARNTMAQPPQSKS